MNASIGDILDIMEDMIESATKLPLSGGRCLIDAEQFMDLIADVKMNIPTEVKQAKMIVQDRKQIIDDARAEAETIVRRGQERARTMVSESQIVKEAQAKANDMITQAQLQSRELKRATNEYVNDILKKTEEVMLKDIADIKATRQALRHSQNK